MTTLNNNASQFLTEETISKINEYSNSDSLINRANGESNLYADMFVSREVPASERAGWIVELNRVLVSYASNYGV